MDFFRVRFINKINKESTVLIVCDSDEHNAVKASKSFLGLMGFTVNDENQETIVKKIECNAPEIIQFIIP